MPITAAVTAKAIADAGIERVFGLPGGEILVLIDEELRRAGVDFVLMQARGERRNSRRRGCGKLRRGNRASS
jgi:thiamine pyrophosphate-dependent acetolactate synthase large subunit-like protein